MHFVHHQKLDHQNVIPTDYSYISLGNVCVHGECNDLSESTLHMTHFMWPI